MSAQAESLLHCSFCAKSQQEVAKLIAGPGVYICDDCVALCDEIIADVGSLSEVHLRTLAMLTRKVDSMVEKLRAEGVPWEDISAALRKDDTT